MVRFLTAVSLLLLLPRAASGVRAGDLDEWLHALDLEIQTDFDERFSGVRVEVKDMVCDRFDIDMIDAEYIPARTLRLELEGLDGECEGDYKWSYQTGIGRIRGDGKVSAKIRDSDARFDLVFGADERGAPSTLQLDNCKVDINLKDLETRGDALGSAASPFLDTFASIFSSDIEKLVCDGILDAVDVVDLSGLVKEAGLEMCAVGGRRRLSPVDWQDLVESGRGPGARIASALYKAADSPPVTEALETALDLFDSFPLVGKDPLELEENLVFYEEKEDEDFFLEELELSLRNTTIRSSRPLSQTRIDAKLDARGGRGDSVRAFLGFPEVEFSPEAVFSAAFAFDDLGDWLVQRKESPILRYDIGLGVSVRNASVDGTATFSVDDEKLRQGLDRLTLGLVAEQGTNCIFSEIEIDDARIDEFVVDYKRSPLALSSASFRPPAFDSSAKFQQETQIAENVVPALVDLVEVGFRDFVDCAIDDFAVGTLARREINSLLRDTVGITKDLECSSEEEDQDLTTSLLNLNETGLLKTVVDQLEDFDVKDLAVSLLESLIEDDDDAEEGEDEASRRFDEIEDKIVVASDGGRVRIGPLQTTLLIEDVYVKGLDTSLTNLTVLPGGLESARRFELAEAAMFDDDVTFGATLRIDSPVGKANVMVNVTARRVDISDVSVDLFLNKKSLYDMVLGTHLGLGELFTQSGDFPLPACLASSIEAVAIAGTPKIKIGSVSAAAWSDVQGLDVVFEAALRAAVGVVRDFVDARNARAEAIFLVNDAIDAQLSTARDTCLKLRPTAPVAERRDARGERPSAVAKEDDSGGLDDNDSLALTVDAFAVVLLLGVMFFTFFLIWLRRKARGPSAAVSDDEDEDDKTSWLFRDTSSRPNENKKEYGALIHDARMPAWVRYGLLLVMIGNAGLLLSSNIAVAAQARLRIELFLQGVGERTIWAGGDTQFSLAESVGQLWRAGSILLALLVALLSGAWPYIELGLLVWGYTKRNLNPDRRERVWRTVEMLSKWSFIDVFIVVFLIVAFYIEVDVGVKPSVAKFKAELFVEARYAFYAFCFATITSMCLGQVVLNLHRQIYRHAETPTSLRTTRQALWRHRLKGSEPRWWQPIVGPLVLVAGALLAYSYTLDVVKFEVGGGAGFLIDVAGDDSSRSFTAPGIAHALVSSTPSDDWRPLVRILEAIVIFFACVAPLAHVILLATLWLVPLPAAAQVKILALSDTAYGWSSLDVYLVSILATATQTTKLADSLAKEQCETVDGYLEAFFDSALDGETQCFRLSVQVRQGCVVLAVACFAQMVLGYLAASVTTAAVAERVHFDQTTAVASRFDEDDPSAAKKDDHFSIELIEASDPASPPPDAAPKVPDVV